MKLTNPLIIKFESSKGDVYQQDNTLSVPTFSSWPSFKSAVTTAMNDKQYDYAVISFKDIIERERNMPDMIKTLTIHAKEVINQASKNDLPVFNRFDGQMYFLNPAKGKDANPELSGKGYAPSDDIVLARRNEYPDDYDWQRHQATVIKKFAATMPLTSGQTFEKSNHLADLTDPKRGLNEKQLTDFFSWKSNQIVIPELMGDNMVGIPSIKAKSFNDISLSVNGKDIPTTPLSLETIGLSGAMIPMRNPRGDSSKYQIATDISPINLILKARAADGVSIQKSEYFDKKAFGGRGEYLFNFQNNDPSHLHVEAANNSGITLADDRGEFDVKLKDDIAPVLRGRGYDLPALIDTIKPSPNSKYIWMSQGTMIGSKKINDTKTPGQNRISPSQAGFITAKYPSHGSKEYLVLVAEGALKGTIAANYLTATDVNGESVANKIAGNRGVIVAQVPGVAKAFVESVSRIYDEKNVVGAYIAMDADGRENLAVAQGIHSASTELKKNGPVKVMSWDPKQKGIDDALLAIAQHKITVEDMNIHFGPAEKMFPLDQAKAPNPYKLDGTKANRVGWQEEYTSNKKDRDGKFDKLQEDSKDTNVNLNMDDLKDDGRQQ